MQIKKLTCGTPNTKRKGKATKSGKHPEMTAGQKTDRDIVMIGTILYPSKRQ